MSFATVETVQPFTAPTNAMDRLYGLGAPVTRGYSTLVSCYCESRFSQDLCHHSKNSLELL